MTTQLITRDFHGATIRQRSSDGYLNATDMCQATGKLFAGYKRLKSTKEYLDALSSDMQIHTSNIIQTELGLQTNHRDHKNRLYYELTEDGIKQGQYQDTGKKHHSGTPVRTIKWYESVLQFFQALPVPKVFKLT